MKRLMSVLFFAAVITARAEDFGKFVDSCYFFAPKELDSVGRENASNAMDVFWQRIESDSVKYLPMLRQELDKDGHNPFFYFDASHLLVKHSRETADFDILYRAVSKCDLTEIQGESYVSTCQMLAGKGYDTYEFATKILDLPVFKAFLSMHYMYIGKPEAVSFMLLPLKPELYEDKLIARLATDTSYDNQSAIITLLFFACDCKADQAIKSFLARTDINPEFKDAEQFFGSLPHLKDDPQAVSELKEERKSKILGRLSDEAIGELVENTKKIKENYICK